MVRISFGAIAAWATACVGTFAATLIFASAAVAAPTQSATPSSSWPPALKAAVKSYGDDCRLSGGRFSIGDAVASADLTGDRVSDFILRTSMMECDPGASFFVGNSTGAVEIYDGANRSRKAPPLIRQAVGGYVLEPKGEQTVIYLVVGGPNCGKANAKSRADDGATACERPLAYDAHKRQLAFAPLSTIRPFRPDFEGYR